jgi:hypothetical protein
MATLVKTDANTTPVGREAAFTHAFKEHKINKCFSDIDSKPF